LIDEPQRGFAFACKAGHPAPSNFAECDHGNRVMTSVDTLISGDELKAAALKFTADMSARIRAGQGGLPSVFDSWFTRVVGRLIEFDPTRPWEDSVRENDLRCPAQDPSLPWDLQRLRLFLDRWQQGRFVDYFQRKRSAAHYHPRFGTEFGADVLLTCQGAPALMRWHDTPLMKNVFDFAMYPALIGELRPQTVFEIGSGLGASAVWFADTMTFCGIDGRIHSVDRVKAALKHPQVEFAQGDCYDPERLFALDLLKSAPHPWLVVEDAHHNVAAVLDHMHKFICPSDYLVVEDSDIKHDALRTFLGAHPGKYLVDTRFTDYFGRNATCAADSIFIRTEAGEHRARTAA
jgi:cephalosporin hydroxylase